MTHFAEIQQLLIVKFGLASDVFWLSCNAHWIISPLVLKKKIFLELFPYIGMADALSRSRST